MEGKEEASVDVGSEVEAAHVAEPGLGCPPVAMRMLTKAEQRREDMASRAEAAAEEGARAGEGEAGKHTLLLPVCLLLTAARRASQHHLAPWLLPLRRPRVMLGDMLGGVDANGRDADAAAVGVGMRKHRQQTERLPQQAQAKPSRWLRCRRMLDCVSAWRLSSRPACTSAACVSTVCGGRQQHGTARRAFVCCICTVRSAGHVTVQQRHQSCKAIVWPSGAVLPVKVPWLSSRTRRAASVASSVLSSGKQVAPRHTPAMRFVGCRAGG